MQALFDDEFYRAPEDDQKPEFPDLDEELEIGKYIFGHFLVKPLHIKKNKHTYE